MSLISPAAALRHVPRHERWFDTASTRWFGVPSQIRSWLDWPTSLTQRVADHLGDAVRVHVLSERYDRLLGGERALLGIAGRSGRVREVQLEVRGTPYVVARTVFADVAARGANHGLRELGDRALGSLLFTSLRAPVVVRQFASLTPRSSLWRTLHTALPGEERHLWARRAVHSLRAQPLLVTEIFLPQLFAKPVAHSLRVQDRSIDLAALTPCAHR